MANLLTENRFTITGTLIGADVRRGSRKDNGQNYISVDATVQSSINGATREYQVSFFSSELKADGKPNALYSTYEKMPDLINKKVTIDGSLRENRYWSSNNKQIQSSQLLDGRFVKGVASSTVDSATFSLGGFVVREMFERKNKNEEIYRYDIVIGQSNYSQTNMSTFTLHVDPTRKDIVNGVASYQAGQTVRLNGSLDFIVETKVVTEESAFGAGATKTFTNRTRNFYIEGGSMPITDPEVAYSQSLINSLVAAYKAKDVEIQAKGQSTSETIEVVETPKVTVRQTSLI